MFLVQIIEKTFNVWYRLSEALFIIDDDSHLEHYKPYVNRYLAALYRHSRFDPDTEDIPDESDEFMGFRMKVGFSHDHNVIRASGCRKCKRRGVHCRHKSVCGYDVRHAENLCYLE